MVFHQERIVRIGLNKKIYKSPLKNKLFIKKPWLNAIFVFMEKILSFRRQSTKKIIEHPKKILLCNIAHFGDVVISTTVLPLIKKKFPDSEIGFIISTESEIVLKNHPLIARIHKFDHWYLHRHLGVCKAILHHWVSRKSILRELKKNRYEIAIDLYSYFPNTIPLLAKSNIPVRIGFGTGGFGGLLTHKATWNFLDQYIGCAHLYLLAVLGINVKGESPLPFYNYKKRTEKYIVVHMGSLDPLKEWIPEKWIELIQRLENRGEKVILTGKGEREAALCKAVASKTLSRNLSNQLNWPEFVVLIQEARLLISIDSVSVHIAAAAATPTVGLFTGINAPAMWMPPSSTYIGLMNPVLCAPCFNRKGCSDMACIRGIEVEDVYRNILKLIESKLHVTK